MMNKWKLVSIVLGLVLVIMLINNISNTNEVRERFINQLFNNLESTSDVADVIIERYNDKNDYELETATIELCFRLRRIHNLIYNSRLFTNKIDSSPLVSFKYISQQIENFLTDNNISDKEIEVIEKLSNDLKSFKNEMASDKQIVENNKLSYKDINSLLEEFYIKWETYIW